MVDRRRLRQGDSYTPSRRGPALAKQRAAAYKFNQSRKPFRTEQTPGTQGVPYGGPAGGGFGDFKGGLFTQQMRNQMASYDKARAESYRPETQVKENLYKEFTA